MAAEDLLNDGERQALTPKVMRKRAEAVLSIAQLAEVLDLSREARGELVDKVRVLVSEVDGKVPRQLTQAVKNLTHVLADVEEYKNVAPLAIEAPTQPDIPAAVEVVELESRPVEEPIEAEIQQPDLVELAFAVPDQSTDAVGDDDTVDEAEGETLDQFAARQLEAFIGEFKELEFRTSDAQNIAKILLILRGKYRHHKDGVDYERLLVDIFSNISRPAILEKHALTSSQLSQWTFSFKTAIFANHSPAEAAQLFRELISAETNSEQLDIPEVDPEAETEKLVEAPISIPVAPKPPVKPEVASRPIPQPPRVPLPPILPPVPAVDHIPSHIINSRLAEIRLSVEAPQAASEKEWEKLASGVIIELAKTKAGFDDEEATALWNRLHFDDWGRYKAEPSPVTIAAMNKLRRIFNEHKDKALAGHKLQGASLATLLSNSQATLKTLDEAHTTLLRMYPNIAPTLTQRYVVSGAVEVLNAIKAPSR